MDLKAWLPEERDHAGAEHLDPEFVAGYDRKQGSVAEQVADQDLESLRSHGISERSTVVDLGAGTGRFAFKAAEVFAHVVAVDVSPAMTEVLRRRVAEHNYGNVEVVQTGWLTYRHTGPPADAVHSRNVLHQLPDAWKAVALHRVAQALRPGGVLRLRDLIYDCAPGDLDETLERWFDGAVSDPACGYTREDLIEHVRTEYSTFSWLLVPMLEHAGFEVIDASNSPTYGAYTCHRK